VDLAIRSAVKIDKGCLKKSWGSAEFILLYQYVVLLHVMHLQYSGRSAGNSNINKVQLFLLI
jgi:hypothetical protein